MQRPSLRYCVARVYRFPATSLARKKQPLKGVTQMKKWIPALLAGAVLVAGMAKADKTAGEVVDDSTVNASVKAALIGNKTTKAHDINVETYKGVVQLSGFVDTAAEKDEA